VEEAGPALRLDRGLRVIGSNPAAEAMLARQEAVALTEGVLRPRRAPERSALQALALRLTEEDGRQPLMLRSRQGAPVLLIILRAEPNGTLLARLAELEGTEPPRPEELVLLFGLTGSEARVLALVAVGVAPAEVAAQFGLKPETVRGHLKAGMRKLGVRSQAQLAGLVLRALHAWRA
jgi:DNA-binding CsgD family transcriptional regulator